MTAKKTTSKKVKNEVATKTSNNLIGLGQEDIPGLIETIDKKIEEIKKGIPKGPVVTGELDPFGKISDINSLHEIIQAHSSVVGKAKAFRESAKALLPEGVKTPVFKLNGFTEEQWVNDIKSRTIEVAYKSQLDTLSKAKTELESNLSEKMRLAKSLAKVQAMLTDDEGI